MNKFSLGVFAGGYKPFTLGHFSMLALAANENGQFYYMVYRVTKRLITNSNTLRIGKIHLACSIINN